MLGDGGWGQLGDGLSDPAQSPVQVTALGTSVAQVAAGYDHTCARKADGTLWCWGHNQSGQLGTGSPPRTMSPVQVTALGASVAQVATGISYTCARKADGTLWCWGLNSYGQLGNGSTTNSSSPTRIAALGTAVAQVAVGDGHACARKNDGTLWCWGDNGYGQLGNGSTVGSLNPVQVVNADGSPLSAIWVSARQYNSCARKTDGTAFCWGANDYSQVGDGTFSSASGRPWLRQFGAIVAMRRVPLGRVLIAVGWIAARPVVVTASARAASPV